MLSLITLALCLPSLIRGQFVQTPTNFTTKTGNAGVQVRYKEVPTGICELDPNVKSYAGYSDVASDQHYFWWFFEARSVDPTTAPLTIWINGGPGSTSMYGLWQELGPCRVDSSGSVISNAFSWSNQSNMIFIDQPVPVGFSYSNVTPGYVDPVGGTTIALPNNTCPDYAAATGTCGTYSIWDPQTTVNSTQNAAPNFYKTLQGFLGAFPQYANGGVVFSTESYGGHYGPIFSRYIVEQNKKGEAAQIDLRHVIIGNGWYDPFLAYQAYYNYTVSPGNPYDYSPYNASIQAQLYNSLYGAGNCVDQLQNCIDTGDNNVCMDADQFCAINVEIIFDDVTGRDEYDVRELEPDPYPTSFFEAYLQTEAVQQAIGAFQNFSSYSNLVGGSQGTVVGGTFGSTGDDGREVGTIEALRYLLTNNISVTIYAGDADYNCNYLGGLASAELVQADGFSSAGFANISVQGLEETQGVVKQSGAFSFTRVYYSGHEVPFYQPELALAIFTRAINRKDIATGQQSISGYTSQGPSTSDFREGNSTIQTSVIDPSTPYNTTTHAPQSGSGDNSTASAFNRLRKQKRRSQFRRRRA